jgi:hypothetical protein
MLCLACEPQRLIQAAFIALSKVPYRAEAFLVCPFFCNRLFISMAPVASEALDPAPEL